MSKKDMKETADSAIIYFIMIFIVFLALDNFQANAKAPDGDGFKQTYTWQKVGPTKFGQKIESAASFIEGR